jgi:hypothetical protein
MQRLELEQETHFTGHRVVITYSSHNSYVESVSGSQTMSVPGYTALSIVVPRLVSLFFLVIAVGLFINTLLGWDLMVTVTVTVTVTVVPQFSTTC